MRKMMANLICTHKETVDVVGCRLTTVKKARRLVKDSIDLSGSMAVMGMSRRSRTSP